MGYPAKNKVVLITRPQSKTGGRPSKRTPQLRRAILREVVTGTPKTKAAVFCGLSRRAFHVWQNDDAGFRTDLETAERLFHRGQGKAGS